MATADSPADPLAGLDAVTAGLTDNSATLATGVAAAVADRTLAANQFAALAAWVEAEHPGAIVVALTRSPFVTISAAATPLPALASIVITPALGQIASAAGIPLGSSFNINYQGSPDNTYPWDQVPYTRVYEELANQASPGVVTEEVVFQDKFLVPTVTNTTTISTSFTSADAQIALAATYGLKYLVYLLPGPSAHAAYTTAITNAGNTSAAALQMMTTLINAIVPHFAGKVKGYVIFNEVIQFGQYNSNDFVNLMGTDFTTGAFAKAIQLIHAADPAAEVWLNTNHIETDAGSDPTYWTFFRDQGIGLKTHGGTALTGLSLESHLLASFGNNTYTQLTGRCNAAIAAGLKVAIGELDVTDDTLLAAGPSGIATRDATASAITGVYMTNVCVASQLPAHVIPWQWTDGTSWLNEPPETYPGGSPNDRQGQTTDGDAWTIGGTTYYTHEVSPQGTAQAASGNVVTITVAPGITTTITAGTAVTFTKGLTGSTIAFTGSLKTNATVTGTAGTPIYQIAITSTGTLTGRTMEGTHGRPTVGFDEAGNPKPAYYELRAILTALAPGGTPPSAMTFPVAGATQRYYVQGYDQHGALLVPQPTLQLHTSSTGILTVPNNPTLSPDGTVGTFLATSVGNGTATITATSGSVTSNTMTATLAGATHEPGGFHAQIVTGDITTPPAASGSWVQGTDGNGAARSWSMFSTATRPTTAAQWEAGSGGWSGCLTLIGGGTPGWRFAFPSDLPGGFQCVSFGATITSIGSNTGKLYGRCQFRTSVGFTNNGNVGTKLWFPRTNNNENHFVSFSDANTRATKMWWSSGTQNAGPSQTYDSEPGGLGATGLGNGNVGDGAWHTLEFLWQAESVPGSSTGSIQNWVDGAAVVQSLGSVRLFNAGETPAFTFAQFVPTYGGGLNSPPSASPPQPMYFDVNQFYVSTQ